MEQTMLPDRFSDLVNHIAEASRRDIMLTEDLSHRLINCLTMQVEADVPKLIALAVRQLGSFCDWIEFDWANNYLKDGGSLDDVPLEVRRINNEREAFYSGPEFGQTVADLVCMKKTMDDSHNSYFEKMRDAETLIGFDQEVTNELFATLGIWGDSGVPGSLLDILPEDLSYPLEKNERASPYDHRLHLLVRELVSRLGDVALSNDDVIQEAGHVLAAVLLADAPDASTKLIQQQVMLRAEAYVNKYPRDVIGLCWWGELSCWAWDETSVKECAERIWERVHQASANEIVKITDFFALTSEMAADWSDWGWDQLVLPRSHLGEIEFASIGIKRPLALAVVHDAVQRGVWDTPLLRSTFNLRESYYFFEADDLPVQWWVWMAENIEHSRFGNELYIEYWTGAFKSLTSSVDSRLIHNILAVLLTARLFDTFNVSECPSILEILTALTNTYRADSTAHKREAALEGAWQVLVKINPNHLTAADRLAISKSLSETTRPLKSIIPVGSPVIGVDEAEEDVHPIILEQAELVLRSQIGESTWARLATRAREEFRLGEFLYILASKQPGEGGNFDSFVLHYSNGLLSEIQESLRGPLMRNHSLKRQFPDLLGERKPPEWSQLARLALEADQVASSPLGKYLLAQRVALPRLKELSDFFESMRRWRNDATHTSTRISRDEATLMHGLLVNKGMIRQIVEFFPKVPKR